MRRTCWKQEHSGYRKALFYTIRIRQYFRSGSRSFRTKRLYNRCFPWKCGEFWNRDHVYKNLGYQYFLIGHIFSKDDKMLGYGILDKQLLRESASELEHLQQPFYAKFLTVTNHTLIIRMTKTSRF